MIRRAKEAENSTNIKQVLRLEEKRQQIEMKKKKDELQKERMKAIGERIYENYKVRQEELRSKR